MSSHTLTILLNTLLIAGGLLTLYSVYFAVVALFGFRKKTVLPPARPGIRFAMVVAARNEEAVIGQLVDSALRQNYPREMYDIIVAPNNCTDGTRKVARQHGALIFDPVGKIRSKGEVLNQVADAMMAADDYDAICVFDADNLIHPDFLQKMNDAIVNGAQVAQGFRDSKNPADTAVSTCYSVCYWMLNKFYNSARSAVGLSGLVNGSGFMVTLQQLRLLGGWHTSTMTEDYEFSAQCVLAGQRVHYVPEAIIYDEQPLTFLQSWKQRRRWSTGSVEGMECYLPALVKHSIRHRSWVSFDLALTFMTPGLQMISLFIGAASALLGAYQILEFQLVPLAWVLMMAVVMAFAAFLVCCLLAAFVIQLTRKSQLKGTGRGIAYFALFLLSWLPIGIISFFKRQKTWDAIAHTRAVSLHEMNPDAR